MKALIESCKKGDRIAQRRFFEKYADNVFRVCLRYMGDISIAEDCVSETFIKVFGNLGAVEFWNEKMLFGWIRKIAVNECLMMLRKNVKFKTVSSEEIVTQAEDENILSGIEINYLLSIIQSLPTGYRTVFNLYVVEGYSHKEISAMLGINEGTSKSQLNKARGVLKEKIKQGGYYEQR